MVARAALADSTIRWSKYAEGEDPANNMVKF